MLDLLFYSFPAKKNYLLTNFSFFSLDFDVFYTSFQFIFLIETPLITTKLRIASITSHSFNLS